MQRPSATRPNRKKIQKIFILEKKEREFTFPTTLSNREIQSNFYKKNAPSCAKIALFPSTFMARK